MGLVVVVLAAALAVGRLAGGRLRGLAELHLTGWPLLVAAVAVQLVGGLVGGAAYAVGLGLSAVLVLGFLAANRGLRGTGLVALGLLANGLVVGLNGAMPVRVEAAGRAGVDPLVAAGDPRHELEQPGTRLPLLGDVVPAPLPLVPQVVSPGDVLVAAGLAELVVVAMGAARPRRTRAPLRPHLPPLS